MVEEEKTEEGKKIITLHLPRLNLWAIATLILAIALVSLYLRGCPKTGMSVLTQNQAAEKAVKFINENMLQEGTTAKLTSVNEENGVYHIKLDINGRTYDSYVTKDGKLLFPTAGIDLDQVVEKETTTTTQSQQIPKADKPTVELYIFSYCPFGAQALDSFAEVASFLKNYADFKVKFFSHMHGDHEKQQNMIQECIQKIAPDKYFDYAKEYSEKVYSSCASQRSVDCDKDKTIELLNEVGIDPTKVFDCVEKEGEELYQQDISDARNLGLGGSPSFVINGVYARINRSPEGIKSAVCSAFNTPPEKCSESLSASGGSTSGNC
ncbi:MAG: DsbA family protein [Candidatus Heimdallarchaeota archaeon]